MADIIKLAFIADLHHYSEKLGNTGRAYELLRSTVEQRNNTSSADAKSTNPPSTDEAIYLISTTVIFEQLPIKRGATELPKESLKRTSSLFSEAKGFSITDTATVPERNIS